MTITSVRILKTNKTDKCVISKHLLSFMTKSNYTKMKGQKPMRVKLFNWFLAEKNKIERYIVCKAKEYTSNKIIYLYTNYYNYYLYTIEEYNNNEILRLIKTDIDTFGIGKYLFLDKHSVLSNKHDMFDFTNLEQINVSNRQINKYDFVLFMINAIEPLKQTVNNKFSNYNWFFALNDINPSGSYEIDINDSYLMKQNKDLHIYSDKNIFTNIITDSYIDINRLSLDIECQHFGIFPVAESNPISHIAIELYNDSLENNKLLILVNTDIINDFKEEILELDKDKDRIFSNIYVCTSEKNILDIIQYILINWDIDYVLTYNGHRFDIPYINGRLNVHNKNKLKTRSAFGLTDLKETKFTSSYKNKDTNTVEYESYDGAIYCDLFDYIKRMKENLDNYKLETVCKNSFAIECEFKCEDEIVKVLPINSGNLMNYKMFYRCLRTANYCFIDNIAHKIVDKSLLISSLHVLYDKNSIDESYGKYFYVEMKETAQFYKNNKTVCISKDDIEIGCKDTFVNYDRKTAMDIAYYCIHDTILCGLLFDYEKIHDKVVAFSSMYLLPQTKSFTYRGNKNISGFILKFMLDNKIMLHRYPMSEEENYCGGKVFEPKKKFVKGPVGIFDFNSLYPSVMISCNISPEKIVAIIKSDSKIIDKYIDNYLINNFKYPEYYYIKIYSEEQDKTTYIITDRREIGFIPCLLKYGLDKRKEYKNLEKQFKDDFINSRLYHSLQYVMKITVNTIYGLLPTRYFVFPSKQCAQMCTAVSRQCIQYVHDIVNNSTYSNNILKLNKVLNIFDKTSYNKNIYNYDDNGNLNLVVIYGDTDSLFIELLGNINNCDRFLLFIETVINEFLPRPLVIELETVEKPMILLTKKKYISMSRRINTTEYDLKTKGCSYIRRDYANFHKNHIKNIYIDIMKSIEDSTIYNISNSVEEYIKSSIKQLLNNITSIKFEDFIITRRYGSYADNCNTEFKQIIIDYNNKNPNNIIKKGARFSFVYGKFTKNVVSKLTYDKSLTKEVNSQIIIVDDSIDPNTIRISVEIYINRLLSDICRSIIPGKRKIDILDQILANA